MRFFLKGKAGGKIKNYLSCQLKANMINISYFSRLLLLANKRENTPEESVPATDIPNIN